jgi:hypothetical protein
MKRRCFLKQTSIAIIGGIIPIPVISISNKNPKYKMGIDFANDKNLSSITATTIWEKNNQYISGHEIIYQNNSYKCIQHHISQLNWKPSDVPVLWKKK